MCDDDGNDDAAADGNDDDDDDDDVDSFLMAGCCGFGCDGGGFGCSVQ